MYYFVKLFLWRKWIKGNTQKHRCYVNICWIVQKCWSRSFCLCLMRYLRRWQAYLLRQLVLIRAHSSCRDWDDANFHVGVSWCWSLLFAVCARKLHSQLAHNRAAGGYCAATSKAKRQNTMYICTISCTLLCKCKSCVWISKTWCSQRTCIMYVITTIATV